MTQSEDKKARIPYDRKGSGAPVIVLIHGFLDAAKVWDPVVEHLVRDGLSTVTFDLPGMGGTVARPSSITLDRYADDVASIVAEIGEPVVLVGQSMGAQVAELVAGRMGDLVKGLMLLTPVPLGGVGAPLETLVPFATSGGKPDVQRGLRKHLSSSLDGRVLDDLTALGDPVEPDVVARLVKIWNEGHPLGHAPSSFLGPIKVVRGSADPFVDEAMATQIASRFTTLEPIVIPDAGHWVHIERPAEVAAIIEDLVRAAITFFKTVASDGSGDWKGAFSEKSQDAFAETFAEDVTLEASTLNIPVVGRELVKKVMEAASKVYASLTFTDQATAGRKQYLEWTATAHAGVEFGGVTVLTRNAQGAIEHVAIHHRPMQAAIFFSQTLGESLAGEIDAAHFLQGRTLAEVQ